MQDSIVKATILATTFAGALFAAEVRADDPPPPPSATESESRSIYIFQVENDVFNRLSPTDRDYTNGVRIGWLSPALTAMPPGIVALTTLPTFFGEPPSDSVVRRVGVSFGQRIEALAPAVRPYAQATSFRTAGYHAAADEIVHVRESASEVRRSRRKLTIPVVVVTGGRGADEHWRQLQRDQASLSERGCLIIAQQSGHVVAIDQPEVVVDAIRTVVDAVRGNDASLRSVRCAR